MSVINKMLQDLDRRNAGATTEPEPPARPVKAIINERHGHEWFWRITAVLVLASVAWVGWVAYQLQPRSVATEQALRAALQPRSGPIVAATSGPASQALPPAPVAQTPAPVPAAPAPTPMAQPAPPPVQQAKPEEAKQREVRPLTDLGETFKLARAIQTPIAERKAPAVEPRPAPVQAATPQAATPQAATPKAPAPKPAKPQALPSETQKPLEIREIEPTKGSVNKRETVPAASDAGETQFRRAAALLKQGRVSEAEHQFVAALQANPAHLAAAQAHISLLLEQQRIEAALRALRDALAAHPGHPAFLLTLARIHAEQRNYPAALEVMDKAGAVSESADFQSLRGTVLLRLGRHAEAVGAYQKAVQAAPQPGETWTGFGISLEAVGRSADAAIAYRRALGAGPLPAELRDYAETRIRALK